MPRKPALDQIVTFLEKIGDISWKKGPHPMTTMTKKLEQLQLKKRLNKILIIDSA
jgi:hypothetical protein